MASDNSGLWIHKYGFTSRDIKQLTVFAVSTCMFVTRSGCGRFEDSASVNLVVYGF